MNRFCELVNCTIPIIQAPTGSVAGSELARAVALTGAVGGLGLSWKTSEQVMELVREVKNTGVFLVNYALSFDPKTLPIALENGAPIITFSWGRAKLYVELCHSFGAKVGVQVGNLEGAKRAFEDGADFLIVQGVEAGGHVQSTTPISVLLPRIIEVFGRDLPIVATGGIASAQQIANAMIIGADAVMLGTRFVGTRQSLAHEDYKNKLVTSCAEDTAYTICFDGEWEFSPHRVLRNSTLDRWEAEGSPKTYRPGEGEIVGISTDGEPILRYEGTAPRVGMSGQISEMAMYAGTGVSEIQDIPDAGDLVMELWRKCLNYAGSMSNSQD